MKKKKIEVMKKKKIEVMNEKKIEEPELFSADFDLNTQQTPKKRYLILSQQRTGSTYISRRLCNISDRFGVPGEYFHELAFKNLAPRILNMSSNNDKEKKSISLHQYVDKLESLRTTNDGFFGMKIQPHHLSNVFKQNQGNMINFLKRFDFIILLTRKDKLNQAISTSISAITDVWHPGKDEIELTEAQKLRAYTLIVRNISRFHNEEILLLSLPKIINVPIKHFYYEDLERDPDAFFKEIVKFLSGSQEDINFVEDNFTEVPIKNESKLTKEFNSNFINFIKGRLAL